MESKDKLADIQDTFNETSLVIPASSFELVDARTTKHWAVYSLVCWQAIFTVKHCARLALANLAATLPQTITCLLRVTCLGWDGYTERHCRSPLAARWGSGTPITGLGSSIQKVVLVDTLLAPDAPSKHQDSL
jgi:hypothetical protein